MIFTSIITLAVGGLGCYHGKLACSNTTTNEELRGKLSEGNIFDRGCIGNCNDFWAKSTSRVFIDEAYEEEAMVDKEPHVYVLQKITIDQEKT